VARKSKQRPSDIERQRGVRCMRQVCSSLALSMSLTILPALTQPALFGAVTPPSPAASGTELERSSDHGRQPRNDAVQTPFSSDELWTKVLRLLNERNGAVTRERFEDLFGVGFTVANRESDATTYLLEAGKAGYFDARVTIYNDRFKFAAPLNGAHSEWFIDWGTVFGGDAKPACITTEHVAPVCSPADGPLRGGAGGSGRSSARRQRSTCKNTRRRVDMYIHR
jgi:hypothetical protein